MKKFLTDIRSSFWFVPSALVLAAMALAMAALELDHAVGDEALARYPRLFGARAEGARQLVAAIASSTMTVAGVVFSITIVALSLTAAQYSPRVLRNFMGDRANQLVLGVFVGVYVYCILVLRSIRGGEDSFVPGISTLIAIGMALVGIGFLIFFIHHIATSIQVSEIAARIARETIDAIRSSPRPESGEPGAPDPETLLSGAVWTAVPSSRSGYIQRVHGDELAEWARHNARVLRMEKAVGEFVIRGERLLSVSAGPDPEASELNAAYILNTYRDLAQDPAFGLEQLVDIALRALSPGVNDTGTARNALNHIAEICCELASRSRRAIDSHVMHEGFPVLLVRSATFQSMLASVFGSLRRAAVGNLDMAYSLLHALEEIAFAGRTHEDRDAVMEEVAALEESLQAYELIAEDRSRVTARLRTAIASISAAPFRDAPST